MQLHTSSNYVLEGAQSNLHALILNITEVINVYRSFFKGGGGRGEKGPRGDFDHHFHLEPCLRMNWPINVLPLYTFLAQTGTNLFS
jgi:hypothetical protein